MGRVHPIKECPILSELHCEHLDLQTQPGGRDIPEGSRLRPRLLLRLGDRNPFVMLKLSHSLNALWQSLRWRRRQSRCPVPRLSSSLLPLFFLASSLSDPHIICSAVGAGARHSPTGTEVFFSFSSLLVILRSTLHCRAFTNSNCYLLLVLAAFF